MENNGVDQLVIHETKKITDVQNNTDQIATKGGRNMISESNYLELQAQEGSENLNLRGKSSTEKRSTIRRLDWDKHIEELADIEDIMNEDEPDFDDLMPTYQLLNPHRIKYIEKWIDLSLLEEFADNERNLKESYKEIDTQKTSYQSQEELEKLKSFELELESYDELKIQLKQNENAFKADNIYIKFSKLFENESDGLILIERLRIGLSII